MHNATDVNLMLVLNQIKWHAEKLNLKVLTKWVHGHQNDNKDEADISIAEHLTIQMDHYKWIMTPVKHTPYQVNGSTLLTYWSLGMNRIKKEI